MRAAVDEAGSLPGDDRSGAVGESRRCPRQRRESTSKVPCGTVDFDLLGEELTSFLVSLRHGEILPHQPGSQRDANAKRPAGVVADERWSFVPRAWRPDQFWEYRGETPIRSRRRQNQRDSLSAL
jgi:hypothetical protein